MHYQDEHLLTSHYEHTCTPSKLLDSILSQKKAYDGLKKKLQQKEVLNFNLVSEIQPKNQKFELICSFSKVLSNV